MSLCTVEGVDATAISPERAKAASRDVRVLAILSAQTLYRDSVQSVHASCFWIFFDLPVHT